MGTVMTMCRLPPGFLMIYMLEEVLHHLLLRSGLLHQEEGVQSKQGGHGHSHDNVQIAPSEEGIQEGELTTTTLIVLQGLATGSLLYVVFFEILEKERQKTVPGVLQVCAMALGFIFMVLLGLAEVRSEREEEDIIEIL